MLQKLKKKLLCVLLKIHLVESEKKISGSMLVLYFENSKPGFEKKVVIIKESYRNSNLIFGKDQALLVLISLRNKIA